MGRKNLLVRVTVKNPCNQAVVQIKMVKRKFMTKKDIPPFCVCKRERERERANYLKSFLLRKWIHSLVKITNIVQIWPQWMSLYTWMARLLNSHLKNNKDILQKIMGRNLDNQDDTWSHRLLLITLVNH